MSDKKKPYVCSNMRNDLPPPWSATMHVPEGITIEDLEKFFGRKAHYPRMDVLISQTVTEVKPMKFPSALLFYMDYEYDKKK